MRNGVNGSDCQKINLPGGSQRFGKCENLFIEVAVGYMEPDSLYAGIVPQFGQVERRIIGPVVIIDILGYHMHEIYVGPRSVGCARGNGQAESVEYVSLTCMLR